MAGSRDQITTELSRDMGLLDITFIGVGAMIGAGVFALTGFAAGLAGPALMVAFLLNGVIASLTALSYAELGSTFPQSGGAYNWVTEALPRPWGFYTGWANWFAQAVACALYAVTFGVFLTEFAVVFSGLGHDFVLYGFLDRHLVEKVMAALMVGLFAYVNYRGAEETGKAGIAVTSAKVVILGVFVAFGALATFEDPAWPQKFFGNPGFAPNGFLGVMAAMGFTYVAFEGYDIIVQSGEEVMNPGRNIPRAIFYSIVVVIPIYVLVAFAAIGGITINAEILGLAGLTEAVPTWSILGELGELGIIQAAGQFVPYGVPLLLVAGLTATMSALNATLYASSRIGFSMGRHRLLPERLSDVHPKTRSPHVSIAVSSVIIAIMAVTLPIESVAASSSIMFILLFSTVNIAVIALRRKRPDLERPFRVPFMPWIPIAGIILQLILTPFLLSALGLGLGDEGFTALVTMAAWFVLGIAFYQGYSEERELERLEEEAPAMVREAAPVEKEYQVVVALANPGHTEQLMATAVDLARANDGEILVVSVVKLPQQTPLEMGRRFLGPRRKLVRNAVDLAPEDVPVHGEVRIGHDIAQAILNTVEQHGSDALLVGWRHRPRRRDFILGSNVDAVVTGAPCDVLVERIGGAPEKLDSILIPTAGGPHSELAGEVVRALAKRHSAAVRVMNVLSPDPSDEDRKRAERYVHRVADIVGEDTETEILESRDVVSSIVEASSDYDLVVMGAAREPLLQQLVFGAIPEEVARRSRGHVIMVKKKLPVTSLLKRMFGGSG